MFNMTVYFVILLIARTARIACADKHTYIHTHTHETTNVTLAAHAHRRLMKEVGMLLSKKELIQVE